MAFVPPLWRATLPRMRCLLRVALVAALAACGDDDGPAAGPDAPGVPPEKTSLFIVGHGTDLNENSAAAAKREVERITALGRYGEVLSAYMEEPPHIAEWDRLSKCPNVVVVPFFISDGLHSYEDIPVLLGIATESQGAASASRAAVFAHNPYQLRGRTLFYASSIGTEHGFADVILDQVAKFDARHAA